MTTLPLSRRIALGLSALVRPMNRRATMTQLSGLDEHLLRDIGLTRIVVDDMRRMW